MGLYSLVGVGFWELSKAFTSLFRPRHLLRKAYMLGSVLEHWSSRLGGGFLFERARHAWPRALPQPPRAASSAKSGTQAPLGASRKTSNPRGWATIPC